MKRKDFIDDHDYMCELELELSLKKQTINDLQNLSCELLGALNIGNIGNIGVHNMEKWTKELQELQELG